MPNPFDPNSYGQPSFEDLMVGALTESAARAKLEADERAMAEQLRQQARGRAQVQNWASRAAEMDASGYSGDPIDPRIFRGVTPYDAAEMIGVRNDAIADRVEDDAAEAQYRRVEAGYPKGSVLKVPPPVRSRGGKPDVKVGLTPEQEAMTGGYAQEKGEAWTLVPALGNFDDERVMERRSAGLPGWQPEDFDRMNIPEAAAMLADQLKARRIKALGDFSPDYIQSLPVY